MISSRSVVLILCNLVFAQAVSLCCSGTNVLNSTAKQCLDGTKPKELNCENKYMLRQDDNSSTIEHDDEHNLILDEEVIPPDEYCFTTIKGKNVDVYLLCYDIDVAGDMSRQVNVVLFVISVFFIVLTIIVYCLVPEILELQDICLIHFLCGLAIAYMSLVIINVSGYLVSGLCHFMAYSLYFSTLYSFFWLNIVCFHVWKTTVNKGWLNRIKYWKIIYHVYGIAAPLLALTWVIILNHGKPQALHNIYPGIGDNICWFQSMRETVIFLYAPIACILFLNIIFFIWTAVELWQQSKQCQKVKILKFRLKMYARLFFVMGITWIFEILSAIFEEGNVKWIWIMTDILNALQGFIIFLILVVFRKKIKRAYANRKIGIWRFPAYWKDDRDSECEELNEQECNLNIIQPYS